MAWRPSAPAAPGASGVPPRPGGGDGAPAVRNSHTKPPQGLYGQAAYREGVAQLGALGLTYEAWQYHPQLEEVTAMARAVPQTTMILNHCGGRSASDPMPARATPCSRPGRPTWRSWRAAPTWS